MFLRMYVMFCDLGVISETSNIIDAQHNYFPKCISSIDKGNQAEDHTRSYLVEK